MSKVASCFDNVALTVLLVWTGHAPTLAEITYVISDGEDVSHVVAHPGVINGHEGRVEHNTERYEEVDERIHDEQLDYVSEALPAFAALPVKQELLCTHLEHLFDAHLACKPLADNTCTTPDICRSEECSS